MKRKSFTAFIFIAGLLIISLAVFARDLGIDHNAEWGRGRIVFLMIGLCLAFTGIFFSIFVQRYPLQKWIHHNQDIAFAIKLRQKSLFILPVVGFVFVVYIWFVSVGLWTTWPARTDYYSLLASGFEKHKLNLPIAPSEKLLALSNPYDPSQRQGVGEPLDFSLYKGKFYLYWGPVPALILVALELFVPKNLPDLYLVFGFSYGLFLLQTLLIIAIWDRYFDHLPKWMLIIAVLLVGLSAPSTWMLSTSRIYEAAIAGGQFFLIAGYLTVLSALDRPPSSNMKLLLAGSLWALAVGTRLTLILPIGFIMLMVVYKLWKRESTLRNIAQKILCLGLPLLFGLIGLAWYNWARFGSLSETGLTYQLAGTYIQKHQDEMISYRYVIQNIFNYFLAPFRINNVFPFIHSNLGSIKAILPFYRLPGFYNTNPITGLIYVVPFTFFSLIAVYGSISKKTQILTQYTEEAKSQLQWIILTLAGSSLLTIILLLIFFWAAMRYVADFMPMLLVVSIIGFYQGYISVNEKNQKKCVAIAGVVLAGISLVMSTVLGLSGDIVLFQEKNPALFQWFNMFFK